MSKSICVHYEQYATIGIKPQSNTCQDCGLKEPLRMCATCGYVGCCESKNSHDTQHWNATGHPIIIKFPVTKTSFVYCYKEKEYLEK